eukprot:906448-Prorocentrum_minimum.AAC.1
MFPLRNVSIKGCKPLSRTFGHALHPLCRLAPIIPTRPPPSPRLAVHVGGGGGGGGGRAGCARIEGEVQLREVRRRPRQRHRRHRGDDG